MSRLADWASYVTFRMRLLQMALRPVSRIPAVVIMVLDDPVYDFAQHETAQHTDRWWPAV